MDHRPHQWRRLMEKPRRNNQIYREDHCLSPGSMPLSNSRKNAVSPGTALVADDESAHRQNLKTLLEEEGYQVLEAKNGVDAVELFSSRQPDIVFMDTRMPEMDGFDAVQRIRELTPNRFVPIIFLTSMRDESNLIKCHEVGGDDVLTKPYSQGLLVSKIRAMERISDLHEQVSSLYNRMHQDEMVAEKVFTGAVVAGNVALDLIETLQRPAEIFSGDVLLTAYTPSRDLNILLGDFTGHGLAAALGAMPTSEVFRAMTNKGFGPAHILSGINQKLLSLMPTGMFFAAQFISINNNLTHVTVCNCGMPSILLLKESGVIKHRCSSRGLPLGITDNTKFQEILEHVKIEARDRIMLVSDGVTEAVNSENDQFGQERFERAIVMHRPDESALANVSRELAAFCQDASQADDISLVEIPCIPELLPAFDKNLFLADAGGNKGERVPSSDVLEFTLTLRGNRLRDADPVPLIINHIQELEGIDGQRRLLFTILTELYVNALDHGVLELDSTLKSSPDGFSRYFAEREQRLTDLESGYIQISVKTHPLENGGEVLIQIEDSGNGFDFTEFQAQEPTEPLPSGRGIRLLSELCDSLTYHPPGNHVEAVYSWINKSD
jgi:CheY-like chemotaxis protein